MTATSTGIEVLPALTPAGTYMPRRSQEVSDVAGTPVTQMAQVPVLWVTRTIADLRNRPRLPRAERLARLREAADLFESGTYAGADLAAYERLVARVSGVPLSVVREAATAVVSSARTPESAFMPQPRGAVEDWDDLATRSGHAVWTRRGDLLAVHAAGNHPGPHSLWLEAIALGYRVVVRPSRREPLTAHRVVRALQEAGLGDYAVYVPTDHQGADEVLRSCDLGLVYGGDDVVAKYGNSTSVLPQGPGRAKVLILADSDWHQHIDTIVASVSHQGGVACINATAVLVEGNPTPVAQELAKRLAELPHLPPEDENAVLPAMDSDSATRLSQYFLDQAQGATIHLGRGGVVAPLTSGGALLTPAVCEVPAVDDPRLGTELPFPCVWVAEWTRADGPQALGDTLVLSIIGSDDDLIAEFVEMPGVSNVYVGDVPTYWLRPGVPHDSFLGEFLMRTKTVFDGRVP